MDVVFENVRRVLGGFLADMDGKSVSIPEDEGNSDYQALKIWIERGGEVEAYEGPKWSKLVP